MGAPTGPSRGAVMSCLTAELRWAPRKKGVPRLSWGLHVAEDAVLLSEAQQGISGQGQAEPLTAFDDLVGRSLGGGSLGKSRPALLPFQISTGLTMPHRRLTRCGNRL